MGFYASVNGEIAPAAQARVSVLDNGLLFGDAVYETLRTYGGRPLHLDLHLARLRQSAGRLAIALPPGDDALARDLDLLLGEAGNPESYIRIVVSRGVGDVSYRFERVKGPTIVMLVKPYEPFPARCYTEGVAVVLSSVRRNHPLALDPAIKSCNLINNILAVQEAQARGALEPILLNDMGEVAEGASANVFMVKDGEVLTPPLESGILAGVTRQVVLELCPGLSLSAREEPIAVKDLLAADEAFITSTLKEVMPVATVDGRSLGRGQPGPVTRRLLVAYREYAPRHAR
ncbi:MAG TPA: aminotransferase class IV [Vicinamibacteria bacterium]|nr:aminotransferase class IV [Vicinamibacteria bacterium]